ncbi:MAG: YwhD family protein [Firmicutes bacterium]|nr:YwhD family protein [Bacillota bacterium]
MAKVRKGQPDPACYDEAQQSDTLPIVSADNAYGGRGAKLTAVVVDGSRAWFDEAALHGRTALEQGIRWVKSPDEVPNGRSVYPVWVYIRPAPGGGFRYAGLVAVSMLIDETNKVGYKSLPEHVNQLSRTMNGAIDLRLLSPEGRTALLEALKRYPDVLENSSAEVKQALGLSDAALTTSDAGSGPADAKATRTAGENG